MNLRHIHYPFLTNVGLRKTNKSVFYQMFTLIVTEETRYNRNEEAHVIDGGFLLHSVVWKTGLKIKEICSKYVDYVKKMANPSVVFDGYDENTLCVKKQERQRRSKGKIYPDVVFDENTVITLAQEKFLSNEKNKNRLIRCLINFFHFEGIPASQSNEDADTLI